MVLSHSHGEAPLTVSFYSLNRLSGSMRKVGVVPKGPNDFIMWRLGGRRRTAVPNTHTHSCNAVMRDTNFKCFRLAFGE
jgi:hypothetical protein